MIKDLFLFIEYYGKGKKIKIFLFFVLSCIAGGLEFLGLFLIYPVILLMLDSHTIVNIPFISKNIDNISQIYLIGSLTIFLFVLKNILMIILIYLQNRFVINWKADINSMIMNYYLYCPYKNALKSNFSEKMFVLTTLVAQTLEVFILRFLNLFSNSIISLIIIAILLFKVPALSSLIIFFLVISMFFMNKFFKFKIKTLSPELVKTSMAFGNKLIENISNLKEIRIFNVEKIFIQNFNRVQTDFNGIKFRTSFYGMIPTYMIEIVMILTMTILGFVIIYNNQDNMKEVIALYGVILAAIFRMAPVMNKLQVSLNEISSTKHMVKKLNEEYEKNKFREVENDFENDEKLKFENSISLSNVDFSYDGETKILKNINMEIKKGEFIGIIGLSGSGKSTLADIIMGLLPIDKGEIIIDGKLVEKSKKLATIIGYVPQKINLLNATVKQNISWGENDDKISYEKVEDSLKKAQLYDFIMSKSEGMNLEIGTKTDLSQGQKQRIMIARALYKNPEILILDEATSSLDVEVENEITQMLKKMKREKTIIAIAHRLSTLKFCDRLIYLKDGEIVDSGAFKELSEKYPDFEKLIKLSKI